ncbi:hypothetical protein JKP88DRAFT_263397 [Tribonema minus]|uniref:Retinoblastoma-associated protein B-box domain-containing protein n=1 Tax=Tribonema minus TaxID=303371 RepID=A0A835Z2Z6_9STRA|nr:hypothetical protein JKP88DRAFT_263397 [Tribonema minus]
MPEGAWLESLDSGAPLKYTAAGKAGAKSLSTATVHMNLALAKAQKAAAEPHAGARPRCWALAAHEEAAKPARGQTNLPHDHTCRTRRKWLRCWALAAHEAATKPRQGAATLPPHTNHLLSNAAATLRNAPFAEQRCRDAPRPQAQKALVRARELCLRTVWHLAAATAGAGDPLSAAAAAADDGSAPGGVQDAEDARTALLASSDYTRCVLACCLEVIFKAMAIPALPLSWILYTLEVQGMPKRIPFPPHYSHHHCYYYHHSYKHRERALTISLMVDPFLRYCASLPAPLHAHLQARTEELLNTLVWQHGSTVFPIADQMRTKGTWPPPSLGGRGSGALTLDLDTDAPGTATAATAKPLAAGAAAAEAMLTPQRLVDGSSKARAMAALPIPKFELPLLQTPAPREATNGNGAAVSPRAATRQGTSAERSAARSTAALRDLRDLHGALLGSRAAAMDALLRRALVHAARRVARLCLGGLGLSFGATDQVWTVVVRCLAEHLPLLRGRHLDQSLCQFYNECFVPALKTCILEFKDIEKQQLISKLPFDGAAANREVLESIPAFCLLPTCEQSTAVTTVKCHNCQIDHPALESRPVSPRRRQTATRDAPQAAAAAVSTAADALAVAQQAALEVQLVSPKGAARSPRPPPPPPHPAHASQQLWESIAGGGRGRWGGGASQVEVEEPVLKSEACALLPRSGVLASLPEQLSAAPRQVLGNVYFCSVSRRQRESFLARQNPPGTRAHYCFGESPPADIDVINRIIEKC